jgi:hypothetical protein
MQYPLFSPPEEPRPVTFYGEERRVNEDTLMVDSRKEEIVVQQALSAVHHDEIQKQSYNRFKE